MEPRGPKKKKPPAPVAGLSVAWNGFKLPEDTQDEDRAAFADLVRCVKSVGTYDRVHPWLVLAAARAQTVLNRAARDIDREGTTLPTNNGMSMSHPMLGELRASAKMLAGLLASMGLTPETAKLGEAKPAEKENEWSGLNMAG